MAKKWLLKAKVFHKRFSPKVNEFTYMVYYLCFPIAQKAQLKNKIFSLNRFNLFAYYEKQSSAKTNIKCEDALRTELQKQQINNIDNIILITCPHILGYVFNPVSFWFCVDKEGKLRAVLAEVNNTFGESHSYLLFN